jgi:hypothetical protein
LNTSQPHLRRSPADALSAPIWPPPATSGHLRPPTRLKWSLCSTPGPGTSSSGGRRASFGTLAAARRPALGLLDWPSSLLEGSAQPLQKTSRDTSQRPPNPPYTRRIFQAWNFPCSITPILPFVATFGPCLLMSPRFLLPAPRVSAPRSGSALALGHLLSPASFSPVPGFVVSPAPFPFSPGPSSSGEKGKGGRGKDTTVRGAHWIAVVRRGALFYKTDVTR